MEVQRTLLADQAMEMANIVAIRFAGLRFGRRSDRRILLREPDGPSTDGGKKARQAIVLTPEDGNSSLAIVCGFIDVARHTAELKNFAVVSSAFEERFGQSLDLSRAEYARATGAIKELFGELGFEVRMQVAQRRATTALHAPEPELTPRPRAAVAHALFVLAGLLAGFGLCYLLVALGLLAP